MRSSTNAGAERIFQPVWDRAQVVNADHSLVIGGLDPVSDVSRARSQQNAGVYQIHKQLGEKRLARTVRPEQARAPALGCQSSTQSPAKHGSSRSRRGTQPPPAP